MKVLNFKWSWKPLRIIYLSNYQNDSCLILTQFSNLIMKLMKCFVAIYYKICFSVLLKKLFDVILTNVLIQSNPRYHNDCLLGNC